MIFSEWITARMTAMSIFGSDVGRNFSTRCYMESGDFKAIAISRATRRADMPDTPTFRELYADQLSPEDEKWIDLGSWHGLVTSTKVSDEHIDAFLPLLLNALQDPDVISKFSKVGLSIDYLGPKEFGEVMQISSDLVDEILAGRKTLD
jgi:tripartite-type tricarboxylate transporter receptor subunit TctC